eukprot:jgi/Botrbrau1/17587/Bobra.0166s0029.1
MALTAWHFPVQLNLQKVPLRHGLLTCIIFSTYWASQALRAVRLQGWGRVCMCACLHAEGYEGRRPTPPKAESLHQVRAYFVTRSLHPSPLSCH